MSIEGQHHRFEAETAHEFLGWTCVGNRVGKAVVDGVLYAYLVDFSGDDERMYGMDVASGKIVSSVQKAPRSNLQNLDCNKASGCVGHATVEGGPVTGSLVTVDLASFTLTPVAPLSLAAFANYSQINDGVIASPASTFLATMFHARTQSLWLVGWVPRIEHAHAFRSHG